MDWTPDRIQTLRERLGLSIEEMALQVGLEPDVYRRIEAGKQSVNEHQLAQINDLDRHHVYRVNVLGQEGEQPNPSGFLNCVTQAFPLSKGGPISGDNGRTSVFFDLLVSSPNERVVGSQIRSCARKNGIDVHEVRLEPAPRDATP